MPYVRLGVLSTQLGWLFFTCCLTSAWGDSQAGVAENAARPNILWITSEDNAAHWLGCYGNSDATTPRLDALAAKSVLFNHAYSNAPVCAVARSTILHGVYAVSSGTQHMRSRHPIPSEFQPYVSYLREQGYYCTNNAKTDYKRQGNDQQIWDASSRQAHYKNRQTGQPFFAIFNLTVSHESSLFPQRVKANRKRGIIPQQPRLAPDRLQLPAYMPDLPEVRGDFAIYYDTLTALDAQVGKVIDELQESGLADDTIVFYYSDHGGPTPRGKRYLADTGVRVPMIVHVPEKWQHLSPFSSGQKTDELVSFVDLAPTLLSLIGLEKPTQMQGRAFLGKHRVEPPDEPVVFLYADRFDELEGMRRGLTDGRYKYIRRFTPHLPAAPYSFYSLSMPSWLAWQRAWQAKQIPGEYHRNLWEAPQAVEELYDLKADPWEIRNLASDPQQASRLATFRNRLINEMRAINDTGVIPESMFRDLAGEKTITEYVRSEQFDQQRVLRLALTASSNDPKNLPQLATMLTDEEPVVRYWGALGCAILGESASKLSPQLTTLTDDAHATIRMTAAYALALVGVPEAGKAALLRELKADLNPEEAILITNLIPRLGCEEQVPDEWITSNRDNKQVNQYVRRFASRLATERNL